MITDPYQTKLVANKTANDSYKIAFDPPKIQKLRNRNTFVPPQTAIKAHKSQNDTSTIARKYSETARDYSKTAREYSKTACEFLP